MECPIALALDRVGEWWSMLIVREAIHGSTRFDQFQKALGIAPNMLTRRLEAFVESGLFERQQYSEHPPRYEYVLTERGADFWPVTRFARWSWGNKHFAPHGEVVLLADTATGKLADPKLIDSADWNRDHQRTVRAGAWAQKPARGRKANMRLQRSREVRDARGRRHRSVRHDDFLQTTQIVGEPGASMKFASSMGQRYAFVVAAVAFVILLTTAGVRSAPGLMLVPWEKAFGWDRGTISFAAALGIFLYGLIGPFAAALMQTFGVRRTLALALGLMSLSAFLSLFMTESWQLILTWGVLSGIGTGCIAMVLAATIVSRWFVKDRGLVMGILTASIATGTLIFLPLMAQLLEHGSWKSPVTAIGVATLALIPLVAVAAAGTAVRHRHGALRR